MRFDAQQRWLVLAGLLTATLAAAAWVHDREEDSADAVAHTIGPQANVSSSERNSQVRNETGDGVPQVRLEKLDARILRDASNDPFAPPRRKVKKRVAPKPAPVVAVRATPPPPPSAPPLPFRYMGKLIRGNDVSVFLLQGNRNIVVREGETIDSRYRVDRIADSSMTLTYLPLDQRQVLGFREHQ